MSIDVVCAIIKDQQNRILCVQRGQGSLKGKWECAGGKVEEGETPQQACERELLEELEITVRAGGLDGRTASVVPCCQTLGPPNEAKSVLGHLDTESFEDVYFGEKYTELRKAHTLNNYEDIDYCKNCDFLYQSEEVLAWSNDGDAGINNMLGTGDDFILTDYNQDKMIK